MERLWRDVIDTLLQPSAALSRLRERPAVAAGIIIAVLSQVAFGLDTAAIRLRGPDGPAPGVSVIGGVVGAIVGYLIFILVLHWVVRLLKGKGSFAAAVSALGFTSLPLVLYAPAYLLGVALAAPALSAAVKAVVMVWSIVLDILAVKVVYGLSTARAIGSLVLSVAVLIAPIFFLVMLIGILAILLGIAG